MGWNWGNWGNDNDVEKEIDIEIYADFDVDVDVNLESDTDIDVDIDVHPTIDGNTANLFFSVEALGKDTFTELDFVVLTVEDQMTSIDGFAVSSIA